MYRLWGGNRLKSVLDKQCGDDCIGESWEVSDVCGNETVVANGSLAGLTLHELIQQYKADFLGTKVYQKFTDRFPLLIKYIDAAKPLSIQVHPNDEVAYKRYKSCGKNEMWYIMEASNDAELIVGFNQTLTKDSFCKALTTGGIEEKLNKEKVKKGDVYFIPAGRVHAIGAGIILAEIQQTSDTTYRIYDYDRTDIKTGLKRDLHIEKALDVIDYNSHNEYQTHYRSLSNTSSPVLDTPYFKTNIITLNKPIDRDYGSLDSFVIYMCVAGALTLVYNSKNYELKRGETLLLPAVINRVTLISQDAKVLEISL